MESHRIEGGPACVGIFSDGEFMAQYLSVFVAVAGALAGIGYAIAACLREWFRGRALLLRAERGDPEPPALVQITGRKAS